MNIFDAIEDEDPKKVRELVVGGADLNVRDLDGDTPLHVAVKTENCEIIEYLLKSGDVEIDAKNSRDTMTPLHLAAFKCESQRVCEMLVEFKADVNAQTIHGNTPLHLSMMNDNYGFPSALILIEIADVNVKNSSGQTPLHLAARYNGYDILDNMLEKMAIRNDINNRDYFGRTPLHYAALYSFNDSHLNVARRLVGNGAKADIRPIEGGTILNLCTQKRTANCELIKLFIRNGADPNYQDNFRGNMTVLHLAAAKFDTDEDFIRVGDILLEYGAKIDAQTFSEDLPLHLAVANSALSREVIDWFVKNKASLDKKNKKGLTPLHLAVKANDETKVKALVSNGASIDPRDSKGRTPLHLAAFHSEDDSHLKVCHELVLQGADFTAEDYNGETPIAYAERNVYSNPKILKRLTEGRLELIRDQIRFHTRDLEEIIALKDGDGNELLHWAAQYNLSAEVKCLLLNDDVEVDTRDKSGATPLHTAVLWSENDSHLNTCQILLDHQAKVSARTYNLNTPLYLAVLKKKSNCKIVELLLEKGADLHGVNNYGLTVLHESARRCDHSVTLFLLSRGADVNVKNEDGQTPLHMAIMSSHNDSHLPVCKVLLDAGADPRTKNLFGKTPIDLCSSDNVDIKKLLRSKDD